MCARIAAHDNETGGGEHAARRDPKDEGVGHLVRELKGLGLAARRSAGGIEFEDIA
jgi:hypothetical protein